MVTETVTRLDAGGHRVSQTRTDKPAEDGALVRILDGGGVVLVRLTLALVAAFLAGGLVQRALLARFGVTLGPLALPELEQTIAASETIAAQIAELQADAAAQRREVAASLTRTATSVDAIATLSRHVAQLQRDIARIDIAH